MFLLKKNFINLALKYNVIEFGNYVLKSGRSSPYFFDMGRFNDCLSLKQIAIMYTHLIMSTHITFDNLFGPAYKGIPLATAIGMQLVENNCHPTLTFNRKEAKTHGEKGLFIGAKLTGKTIVIDDVLTAGTAFNEVYSLIKQEGGDIVGLFIAFDRMEKNAEGKLTKQAIEQKGIPVHSLINLHDLIEYLQAEGDTEKAEKLVNYMVYTQDT